MAKRIVNRLHVGGGDSPNGYDIVEFVDGRIYQTTDNWETIFVMKKGVPRWITGREADEVRLIAVMKSSAAPS